MKLNYLAISDIGDRKKNEDFHIELVEKDWALFAVADGLGGHAAGDLAAQYFCQALVSESKKLLTTSATTPAATLQRLILAAAEVMSKKLLQENLVNAHTTCAIAWLTPKNLVCAHIGDSRIYLINKNKILWHTQDHSVLQELVAAAIITEAEMAKHPLQSVLTRSINPQEIPKPEIKLYPPLKTAERLLLCTDGFWEVAPPKTILTLVTTKQLEKTLKKIIRAGKKSKAGHCDNITAQVIYKLK